MNKSTQSAPFPDLGRNGESGWVALETTRKIHLGIIGERSEIVFTLQKLHRYQIQVSDFARLIN